LRRSHPLCDRWIEPPRIPAEAIKRVWQTLTYPANTLM